MVRRALLTGSAGFIGQHFQSHLLRTGWQVDPWDIFTLDRDVHGLFRGWQPRESRYDLIVHAAYHVGGRAAIDGKNTNFLKNISLDSEMFKYAIENGVPKVLYFSSSAIYPTYLQTGDYDHRLEEVEAAPAEMMLIDSPDSHYGMAKAIGEQSAMLARSHGVQVAVVRPFSGYGETQSTDYPFRAILERVKNGDLSVWGPQNQTRDWIHVSDVVQGAFAVLEAGTELPVNLCTGVGTTMGTLAVEMALELGVVHSLEEGYEKVQYDWTKPTGVIHRVGDPTLMKTFYTPKVDLEEGIVRACRS